MTYLWSRSDSFDLDSVHIVKRIEKYSEKKNWLSFDSDFRLVILDSSGNSGKISGILDKILNN